MSTASSQNDVRSTEDVQGGAEVPLDKNDALIVLFEKMGVPLINAISAVEMWQEMDNVGKLDADHSKKEDVSVKYATNLASLLNRTISLSTALSQKLELLPQSDQKHRLDVAAVSTLMIAHQYALTAQIPEEKDLSKITSSLESVLSFADYFSNGPDVTSTGRSPEALLVDCLEAVVPMVQTIGRFSFGKQENALISDILSGLGGRVSELLSALEQDMGNKKISAQKVQVFKSSAQLFTLCYEAEMNNLAQKATGDASDADVDAALKRVWQNFDSRLTLLRTVLGYVNGFFTGDQGDAAPPRVAAQKEDAKKPVAKEKTAKVKQEPSDAPAFSPIQAIIDRGQGKVPDQEEKEGGDSSVEKEPTDDKNEEKSDNSSGDSSNPMSFFTGK